MFFLTYLCAFLLSLMTLAVSAGTTPSPFNPHTKNGNLNVTLTYLAIVASDYATLHKNILSFRGQETAFNAIDTNVRTVESHLKDTISSAAACPALNKEESSQMMAGLARPYPTFMQDLLGNITEKKPEFDRINKAAQVHGWLGKLYVPSNVLPATLEEKLVASDAQEVEKGRLWSNSLFERAMGAYARKA